MFSAFHILLPLLLFFSTSIHAFNKSSTYKGRNQTNDINHGNGVHWPIDFHFKFPSPTPIWPPGAGFASGAIDLGGLLVKSVSTFTKVWTTYQFGPEGKGATFFEPSPIPEGFFMLGSFAQSNAEQQFGSILVAKDLDQGALRQPDNYLLIYTDDHNESGSPPNTTSSIYGYIWEPLCPDGYETIGYLVTTSPEQPPLDKIRCVNSDFSACCEKEYDIWGDDEVQIIGTKPCDVARSLSTGTFDVLQSGVSSKSYSCLFNVRNDLSAMPNLDQVNALIKVYSPLVIYHANEEFFPSSVNWFWENGALLYTNGNEANPVKVEPTGSNLPLNAKYGMHWLDLPRDEAERSRVRRGNLTDAGAYFHIKPVSGGAYTDIAVWIFYPFNGNAKVKIFALKFSLGFIGEHVGDWEHITLRINNLDGELKSVYLSQHNAGEWVRANRLTYRDGNKPETYSCLHSHALRSAPGSEVYAGIGNAIGLLAETDKTNMVLDTGAKPFIIAAEYLGPSFVEAPWLNYANLWGPQIDYDIKHALRDFAHALPNKVKRPFRRFVNILPAELLGQEGPNGPKQKANWNGDESIKSLLFTKITGNFSYT